MDRCGNAMYKQRRRTFTAYTLISTSNPFSKATPTPIYTYTPIMAVQILFFNRFIINRPSLSRIIRMYIIYIYYIYIECRVWVLILPRHSIYIHIYVFMYVLCYLLFLSGYFTHDILLGNKNAQNPFSVTYCLREYGRLTGNHPPSKKPPGRYTPLAILSRPRLTHSLHAILISYPPPTPDRINLYNFSEGII